MIPRLTFKDALKNETAQFLEALVKTPFAGEIRADFGSRLIASTDNSIYQILPQAVIFPRSRDDLRHLFQLADTPAFNEIVFSPRGGGTGTNGQSLSPGIILDCSKYMNRILEFNRELGWVRVQPGVILDQLNAYLQPHGVFFAPSLAPSDRATIGGMINTDACGKGSRIYGRTSHHVLELEWVLSDGTVGRSHSLNSSALSNVKQQSGRPGEIYRQVDEIVTTKRELIEQTFPQLTRFMTGYNLAKVYDGDRATFNLNSILAGSEGTLAVITEAKLKVVPIPRYKKLLAIHYRCFDDALLAAESLLAAEPAAIETIDETILGLAKQDEIYYHVKDYLGTAKAINIVEFVSNNITEIEGRIGQICREIERDRNTLATGYYLASEESAIDRLWNLRKKGVGLLANKPGKRQPIPFIEDTAVPPSSLANYIREFKALLTEYKLEYAMFGHVDVGCLHVRPALDMKVPNDEKLIRELSDKVVALVRKYGGVMWGEHGKGFRSEYTPVFFGDELYRDLRKIKTAFDPRNKLNPGKIVAPLDSLDEIVRLESPLRGHFDRQVLPAMQERYAGAFKCNGNGACFNYHPDSVMCPSAKETGDRLHSPKGRASLLREWLRQLSIAKIEGMEQSGSWPVKFWNTLQKTWGVYDYSAEVERAMAGCLSCKACVSQCPVHVDIPSLKSKFLQLYYTRYLRPWRDYLFGNVETLAKWQSRFPKLANAIVQNRVVEGAIAKLGMMDPPVVSEETIWQGLIARNAPEFNIDKLLTLSAEDRKNSVILLQDAFTSFYESHLVLDIYDFLTHLGYTVYIPPFFASGKPLHVKGFLEEFEAIARRNIQYLTQLGKLQIPIIGIEPSIVLTYRDEYRKIADFSEQGFSVQLLSEFLVTQDDLPHFSTSTSYNLFSHCTEKTSVISSTQQWQKIFQIVGLELTPIATGCCGMAGIYGHETEHYNESKGIYQMSWGRQLPSTPEEKQRVLATGYSCRSQVTRLSGWTPLHPVQALLQEILKSIKINVSSTGTREKTSQRQT